MALLSDNLSTLSVVGMLFSLVSQRISPIYLLHPKDANKLKLILYLGLLALYRLTLHPLSTYPRPPLWSISILPSAYQIIRGTLPYRVASLHDEYWAVIRVGPNELSYIVEEAWNDIYARKVELKRDETRILKVMDEAPGLINADVEGHARMR